MAYPQLQFFSVDKRDAALQPHERPQYKLPFFGGRILSTVIMRNQDDDEVIASEREEFANLLLEHTDFKGSKAFLPGICLQMFGICAQQWEDVQGQLRKEIFQASHTIMPKILKPGEKLYDLGPRTSSARSALKGAIIPSLFKKFPFLKPTGSTDDAFFNNWCDRLWEVMFAAESKILSDRHNDITSNLFARLDQVFKFGWAHSDIGLTSIARVKNDEGAITGFQKANVKSALNLPTYLPRLSLEELSIRVAIHVSMADLAPIEGGSMQTTTNTLTRQALPRSVHIPIPELEALRFEGVEDEDMLEHLVHALEADLDVSFEHDGLSLAWRNPRTFWGDRNVLVRLRNSVEMRAVLEELRGHHLLFKGDRMLYLSLVSIKNKELKGLNEHPPWPESFEVCIAPHTQGKESPKRKLQELSEGDGETAQSPRKRRGRVVVR